jgi:ethanolamine utilization microcompartment shell protein EutS
MEFPPQRPRLLSITEETVIARPTNIVIQALSGSCTVSALGTITVPEGNAISISSDIGNTLGEITVTPTGTTQIIYFT